MGVFRKVDECLRLESVHGLHANKWLNNDVIPLPPDRRTWNSLAFTSFWAINNLCPAAFMIGSSLVALGLSVWQALLSVIIGRVIITFVAVFNGWVGAEWHIAFPVISRYIWGMYGGYIIVIQRVLLSCVWMGTQSWMGGLCVAAVLSAMMPSFNDLKNTMPDSTHMTTKEFIGFFLYCLVSCVFLWIPPEKFSRTLHLMNLVTFATLLAIMIWAVCTAHGYGPLMHESSKISGVSETLWAIAQGVSSVIGSIAVGLTNQPDYSRFATAQGAQIMGQVISIPLFGIILPLFGCITASATKQIYGKVIWNPASILEQWLISSYTPSHRAATFFAGTGLIVAQIAINTVDNAFSGGMDFAGLVPRYLNIRRGAYLTLAISILLQPWQLLSSASVFLSILSAYSVFLGPIVGIMVCDYWLVRKRKIKLSSLYAPGASSIYWFYHGFNLRAFASWVCGFALLLPGLIQNVNKSIEIPSFLIHLYYLAFPLGFLISASVFYTLCHFWPAPGLGQIDDEDIFGTFTDAEAEKLHMRRTLHEMDEVKVDQGNVPLMRLDPVPDPLLSYGQ